MNEATEEKQEVFLTITPIHGGRVTRWKARCDDHAVLLPLPLTRGEALKQAHQHVQEHHTGPVSLKERKP